jgi:hypothetical protein
MKTNHRRNFVDPGSFRDPSMRVLTKKLKTKAVKAKKISNDFTNGHRGAAKSKNGAKKYLRIQERLEGKKLCKEDEEE